MAERSYPAPEVRAMAERSYPASKARDGDREENMNTGQIKVSATSKREG